MTPMTQLYHWHTPFVAAFLVFVLLFVLWNTFGPGARGQGRGR
jgi:hypothetical protein